MAALTRIHPVAHKTFAKAQIVRSFAAKVFYVIRGRNAWHSTWVTHYSERCMHNDLRTAKDRAEQWRERGSVFTIREQPALAFETVAGLLLITEINNRVPLSSWIRDYKKERSEFHLNQEFCQLESFFSEVRTIGDIVRSIEDRTHFPARSFHYPRDLFILVDLDPASIVENVATRFKQWKSSSYGPEYCLGWSEQFADISGKAVRRVANALQVSIAQDRGS